MDENFELNCGKVYILKAPVETLPSEGQRGGPLPGGNASITHITWGNGIQRQPETRGAQEPTAATAEEQQGLGCSHSLGALQRH